MAAFAAEIEEGKNWRVCAQDADCVLIQGTCDKTAVNAAFKASATAYYKELASRAKCVERFWVPKDVIAQCRPKVGSSETHSGSCDVVSKNSANKK